MKAVNLKGYAWLSSKILARAIAHSGDADVLNGYMGKCTAFKAALADFSVAYADQNERDHAALVDAVHSSRIEAQTD
jgi:hypothetical protein